MVTTGWFRNHAAIAPPKPLTRLQRARAWALNYGSKWRGHGSAMPPPRATYSGGAWSFLGAFLGLLLPAVLHSSVFADLDHPDMVLMIGSFAALATLLFAAPASPFAQPRVVLCGHLQSAALAIAMDYFVISDHTDFATAFIPQWVAQGLVPALCIGSMALTGCINPPAAACAFIYVTGGKRVKDSGWLFVLCPTLLGCVLMLLVALVVNNLSAHRRYPNFW